MKHLIKTVQKNTTCIICKQKIVLFGPYHKYNYYICVSCGSLQLYPMLRRKEMDELYEKEYSSAGQMKEFVDPKIWEKVSRTYRNSIVDAVKQFVPSGIIIDFGTGWGFLVKQLRENGLDCLGIEISNEMLQYCKENKIPVENENSSKIQSLKGKVSCVVMCAVFEHLSEHHRSLKKINELLKDDGIFITLHPTSSFFRIAGDLIRLGNRKKELNDLYGAFTAPWHTLLISIRGMQILAQQHGFKIIKIIPSPQGRLSGIYGVIQIILEKINKIGWLLMKHKWPLVNSHIFVLQKQRQLSTIKYSN